jgi:hypothetical protein
MTITMPKAKKTVEGASNLPKSRREKGTTLKPMHMRWIFAFARPNSLSYNYAFG